MSKIHWEEHSQACEALLHWLVSQDIQPLDAVPILITAVRCAIGISSNGNAAHIEEGLKVATRMLNSPLDPEAIKRAWGLEDK